MKHFVGCAVRTMNATPNLPGRTTWGGPAHPTMHNAAQPRPRAECNPVGAAHGRDPLDHSTPIRRHGTRRPPTRLQTARRAAAVALYPAPQPAPATPVRTAWGGPAHPTMHRPAKPRPQAERNPVGAAHGRDPLDHSTPIRGHGTRRPPTRLQTARRAAAVALYPAPHASLVRTAHPTMRRTAKPRPQAERNPVGAAHGRDPFGQSTSLRGHGPLLQTLRTVAKVALYPTRPHRPMESAL
jgi:hypothetical protein